MKIDKTYRWLDFITATLYSDDVQGYCVGTTTHKQSTALHVLSQDAGARIGDHNDIKNNETVQECKNNCRHPVAVLSADKNDHRNAFKSATAMQPHSTNNYLLVQQVLFTARGRSKRRCRWPPKWSTTPATTKRPRLMNNNMLRARMAVGKVLFLMPLRAHI